MKPLLEWLLGLCGLAAPPRHESAAEPAAAPIAAPAEAGSQVDAKSIFEQLAKANVGNATIVCSEKAVIAKLYQQAAARPGCDFVICARCPYGAERIITLPASIVHCHEGVRALAPSAPQVEYFVVVRRRGKATGEPYRLEAN